MPFKGRLKHQYSVGRSLADVGAKLTADGGALRIPASRNPCPGSGVSGSPPAQDPSHPGIRVPRITGLPCMTFGLISTRSVMVHTPFGCSNVRSGGLGKLDRNFRATGTDHDAPHARIELRRSSPAVIDPCRKRAAAVRRAADQSRPHRAQAGDGAWNIASSFWSGVQERETEDTRRNRGD